MTCIKEAEAVSVMNSLSRTLLGSSPSNSIVDLCEWLNNVENTSVFRDIINCRDEWSKQHQAKYSLCTEHCAKPPECDRSRLRPVCWTFLGSIVNGKHTNIYLDLRYFMTTDVSELKPQTHKPQLVCKPPPPHNFSSDYDPGWQLASGPSQLQSINLSPHLLSLNSRPALLIKQHCLSGRISSAWRSPAARPERCQKKDLGCQIVSLGKCYSSNKYEDHV